MPYFPVRTSAPGTLQATKPPPEVPNCVPGSLTYPLDAVVTERRRLGGLGLRQGPRPVGPESVGSFMELPARNVFRRLFHWGEEPETPIAGYHGTHRTPAGPWAPT